MGTGGRASEPLLCVHRARGRDMRQVCVRRHGSARTHRHAAVGPGRVLPCTGSEGPRGPHRPRRESRTARQRPRACGVSALFAQTVEGAGEAGRARRRGAGGRGARCGCAARPASQAGLQRDDIKKRIQIFHALHRHAGSWVQATRGERRYAERREQREGKREGQSRRRRNEADGNDETGDGWRCRRVNKARVGRPRGDMKVAARVGETGLCDGRES